MYDYTIIGAGPTGLTIAWFLAKYGHKILLIERESSVGGCHRVTRVNGLFTEHSPRMYIGNCNTLQLVLKDMGYDFNDIFAKYTINSVNIATKILKELSTNEMLSFTKEYMRFMIDSNHSKSLTLEKFMDNNNFSDGAKHIFDAIARITDGAAMDKYTLYEFLEIINQNILYNNYQPKKPNDIGLFKLWTEALENTGNVTIFVDSEVINLNYETNLINSIKIKKDNKIIDIDCKKCILAIPPKNLLNILNNNDQIKNSFGKFQEYESWALNSAYMQFIAATFHWKKKVEFTNDWVVPHTDWLVAYTILSNCMEFNDDRSKTVISICATKSDGYSQFLGKTPGECSKTELVGELFRQFKEHVNQPDLEDPDYLILSPKMHKKNNIWESNDSAFIYTTDGYKNYKSELFDNLYSVGTQNGNSNYVFTSIESATSNAINFIHDTIPETKKLYSSSKIVTLNSVIGVTVIFMILVGIYFKGQNHHKI